MFAHSTFQNVGPFANGFVHPFTVPAHVLLLLVIGLFLAQPRPLRLTESLAGFVLGAAGGLAGSVAFPALPGWPVVLTITTLVVALSVIWAGPLPRVLRAGIAGLAAAIVGFDSPPGVSGWMAVLPALLGTATALVVGVVDVAFYASLRPVREWADIGVRVVAAWIAAIALMLLAFQLKG